jgi:putative phosphoribosyl transferase
MLAREADRVICLTVPRHLHAVGAWYRDFTPVSDAEVLALLAQALTDSVRPGVLLAR